MTPRQAERLRALPAVGELIETDRVRAWLADSPRTGVVRALRAAVDEARRRILENGDEGVQWNADEVLNQAQSHLERRRTPSLRRVINATGVVLHTGLGRAPLCDAALDALTTEAAGYCNLELDLESGKRGRRSSHLAALLCELTGAQAATTVNNNAAAMVLIMRTLCEGREVIVSRGQLVEIGGSFRMPEIMAAGGAMLREVGTTNRTRIDDYQRAITDRTAALLQVHHSNFRIVGFTEQPPADALTMCAHDHGLIAIDDLGSGAMLDFTTLGLPAEPFVAESLSAGFDVVCFSGDKLLGGPQCGIILGRAELIARIESHPLMRSYRLDKLVITALEATLRQYSDPDTAARNIPTLAMLTASTESLARRAAVLEAMLSEALASERFFVSSDTSFAGGGSLPGRGLETVVIRWRPTFAAVDETIARLRRSSPPVVARISDDSITFDVRTLSDQDFGLLVHAVREIT